MQGKNLNFEKIDNNLLDKLVSKKKSVITVSGPMEDFRLDNDVALTKHPVRKGVVKVTNLKDNISSVQNVEGI
jgi:hypothetical protein